MRADGMHVARIIIIIIITARFTMVAPYTAIEQWLRRTGENLTIVSARQHAVCLLAC